MRLLGLILAAVALLYSAVLLRSGLAEGYAPAIWLSGAIIGMVLPEILWSLVGPRRKGKRG